MRARRLNVIIQPHLRFAYELLKWDEVQQQKRGEPIQRELEWATIAREIAAMNKPYSRWKSSLYRYGVWAFGIDQVVITMYDRQRHYDFNSFDYGRRAYAAGRMV